MKRGLVFLLVSMFFYTIAISQQPQNLSYSRWLPQALLGIYGDGQSVKYQDGAQVWKLDSMVMYIHKSYGKMGYYSKAIVLRYDRYWNATSELYYHFDTISSQWVKIDTLILEFYDRKKLRSILEYPLVRDSNHWGDTCYYLEKTENGQVISYLYRFFDVKSDSFLLGDKYVCKLDEKGHCIEKTKFGWDRVNQVWVPLSRYFYTYYDFDSLKEEKMQKWDEQQSKWCNYFLKIYSYNALSQKTSIVSQSWSDSSWVNSLRQDFYYNDKNQLVNEIVKAWNSQTQAWEYDFQYIYTYDVDGTLLSVLKQFWNRLESRWEDNSMVVFKHDAKGNIIDRQVKFWDSDTHTWLNSSRDTYTYDGSNRLIDYTNQMWYANSDHWYYCWRWSWKYDQYGNLRERLFYNGDDTTWILGSREIYYHSPVSMNSVVLQESQLEIFYPNPARNTLYSSLRGHIRVYNIQGQVVLEKDLNDKIMNLSGLPAGIYTIELKTEGKRYLQKIIKE